MTRYRQVLAAGCFVGVVALAATVTPGAQATNPQQVVDAARGRVASRLVFRLGFRRGRR